MAHYSKDNAVKGGASIPRTEKTSLQEQINAIRSQIACLKKIILIFEEGRKQEARMLIAEAR